MALSKLVFSLVYLGPGSDGRYNFYFKVHSRDERFNSTFASSNGFTILSDNAPYLDIPTRIISIPNASAAHFSRFSAPNETIARAKLQEVVDALQQWARDCPELSGSAELPVALSPEVRESLLFLQDDDETEEGDDGPGPIFFDDFIPPKISLS